MSGVTDDRAIGEAPRYQEQMDVDEKLEADRLQAINEARKTAHKVRQNSRVGQLSGSLSEKQACGAFREALESFLIEIRQYRGISDRAQIFWTGTDERKIGRVTIYPPAGVPGGEARVVDEIRGLDDILQAPAVYTQRYSWTETQRHGGTIRRTAHVQEPLSRDVLKTGLLWANEFCNHIGLDLDIDTEDHYSKEPGL